MGHTLSGAPAVKWCVNRLQNELPMGERSQRQALEPPASPKSAQLREQVQAQPPLPLTVSRQRA